MTDTRPGSAGAPELTAAQWAQLDPVLDAALDAPAEQREPLVRSRLKKQPDLVNAALAVLAAGEQEFLRFGAATVDESAPLSPGRDWSLDAGDQVGQWAVVQPIGHGGMGEVYRVERADGGFAQRGALKLLRIDAAAHRARFNAERQLLANLEHPGIARLLGGGEHSDGRAYAVMEYVAGQPLDVWLAAARPTLKQRLEVFLGVSEAVAHAHAQPLVHRDIKPANVRMTPDGQPKLLDFGIAKLLDDGAGRVETTLAIYTPAYAAPEQLAGEHVGTAADIYGLGALLHFLLTGRAPWALDTASLPMVVSRHMTGDAAVPSAVARQERAASTTADTPTGLAPAALRGDLDAIVGRATRQRPQDRYETVAALAADVRAHLHGDAVAARVGQRSYRVRHFLRRYAWQTAAVAALIISLAAGLASTLLQADRAAAERDAAVRELERARSVRTAMTYLLGTAQAPTAAGDDPTLQALIDSAADNISDDYADDPETAAELMREFGSLHFFGNRYNEARPLLQRAVDQPGANATTRAAGSLDLAAIEIRLGNLDTAEQRLAAAQSIMAEQPERFRQEYLESLQLTSQLQARRGDTQAAVDTLQGARAEQIALTGRDNTEVLTLLSNLSVAHVRNGDMPAALRTANEAYAVAEAINEVGTPAALDLLNNMGLWALKLGALPEAERRLEQAYALRTRLFGDSAAMAALTKNLGELKLAQAKFDEAQTLLGRSTALAAEFTTERSPLHMGIATFYAQALMEGGRLDAAATALEQAQSGKGVGPPLYHARFAMVSGELARRRGNFDAAESAFDRADALAREQGPGGARFVPEIVAQRARLASARGNHGAAGQHWRTAQAALEQARPDGHWSVLRAEMEAIIAEQHAGTAALDATARLAKLRTPLAQQLGAGHPMLARLGAEMNR